MGSRTTTPCVPPEAPLTLQRTPRTGSMSKRQSSLDGDPERDQEDSTSRSPRDSECDGCINMLDDASMEGAEGESVQVRF